MSSWTTFLDKIEKLIQRLNDDGCDIPFFRGHNDKSWKLIPSLFRYDYIDWIESTLYYDFISYSAPLFGNNYLSPWDILFEMRHYGLPTRLLDWSENFSAALYFAVKGDPVSPCIWILDPYKLNLFSYGKEELLNPVIDFEFTYPGAFIEKKETTYINPIAIIPTKQSKRVFAQKGVFTIHFENQNPINKICKECMTKIAIPNDAIEDAKKFLRLAGINEYSMFPDFDGLSRYLKEKHLL